MARIQGHHITYEPEWKLDLNMLQHRAISRIQNTRATQQAFADMTNFMHAVAYEWNRMRMELDTGLDLRVLKRKKVYVEAVEPTASVLKRRARK